MVFDENTPRDVIGKAIQASGSLPAVFPPVNLDGMTLVDGGVFTNLDLGDAINRCKEMVDNDEDIIVDMILIFSEPEKIQEWTLEEA